MSSIPPNLASHIRTGLLFVWIGFVCAISFMEAWLKFLAEGVTRAIGLSIGKLIFFVLNKVEWILFFLILLCIFRLGSFKPKVLVYIMGILLVILLAQTFFLLPILDERALRVMQNQSLAPSPVHIIYILLEILKLFSLLWAGRIFLTIPYNPSI